MSTMRSQYTIRAITGIAAEAIKDNQPLARGAAAGTFKVATGAANEKFVGFANQHADIGLSVGAITIGQACPVALVDITEGDLLKAAAGGKVDKATGTDFVIARAESSAVAGERVTLEITGTF